MTITRKKPGRVFAPASAEELPSTTCHVELGGTRALVGEAGAQRFNATDLAVLAPSIAAIELATHLGKPDAFLADHCAASQPPKKHTLTDDERSEVAALRKSREHTPAKREDLISAVWAKSRAEQKRLHRECRVHAKRWITLVRLYERDRPYLLTLPYTTRVKFCLKLANDVRRASSNDIPAANRAEARRRAQNRRALGKDMERRRKRFGWRGRTDDIGGDGYASAARRMPATPMTPDGQVDGLALAQSEVLLLNATWRAGRINSGVGIKQGLATERGDQWSVTEDLRIAKRLTDEVKNFLKRQRDRSA